VGASNQSAALTDSSDDDTDGETDDDGQLSDEDLIEDPQDAEDTQPETDAEDEGAIADDLDVDSLLANAQACYEGSAYRIVPYNGVIIHCYSSYKCRDLFMESWDSCC